MRRDFSFLRRYEVEVDVEFPPRGGQIFFPREGVATYRLAVRVQPAEGPPWVGAFAGEGFDFSAVASTPDADTLCVVARGTGYLVRASDPPTWTTVESFPVRDLAAIVECGLLVFADHSSLTAYGSDSVVWTRRLGSDDLAIAEATPERIAGTVCDLGTELAFALDSETGRLLPC